MAWRPPELPPVQKMPRPRGKEGPSRGARIMAAVAGVAFAATALLGLWRALGSASRGGSPFGPLALLIPAAILLRYAWTGQIKIS